METLTPLKNNRELSGVLIALLFACFVFSQSAQTVVPPPDGGYPGSNTAEGQSALFGLTSGGFNTGVGFLSLSSNTTGNFNTATGAGTLLANTADQNTATGAGALLSNTTGDRNTATGTFALFNNTTGNSNTGEGWRALFQNTTGNDNTATGFAALDSNSTGALNTANGTGALVNSTGDLNIALGFGAGVNLATGNNNIDIGNVGAAMEANIIRIGAEVAVRDPFGVIHPAHTATYIAGISGVSLPGGTPVVIDVASGQLGIGATSSQRFKDEIKPMNEASEALFALKPVTFRYKKEVDSAGIRQFGLVAEQVEKVNPDLVVRDKEGKPYSLRYDQVNAMLLNEFLKEHRKVEEQEKTIVELKSGMAALAASLKEQASQIQKVSAQLATASPSRGGLEASKFATGRIRPGGPAPRAVNNNQ